MRIILSFLSILLSGIAAFSQTGTSPTGTSPTGTTPSATIPTGTIIGVIRTSDGYPAESVSIGLKGTHIVTLSDKKGSFEIKKIKPGVYILVASFAGHTAKEVTIEVKKNEVTIVPVLDSEVTMQVSIGSSTIVWPGYLTCRPMDC